MTMHIGQVGAVDAVRGGVSSHWKQGMQGFSALKSALQAGDIDAAKQALSKLHIPSSTHAKSPLAQIARAIESGDIALAQKTMQAALDARMSHARKSDAAPVVSVPPTPVASGSVNLLA